MTTAQQKTDFLNITQAWATIFCQTMEMATRISDTYTSRGYQAAGANPITDTDAATINCTAVTPAATFNAFLQAARSLTYQRWFPEADRT
jgi:hypothetical protein